MGISGELLDQSRLTGTGAGAPGAGISLKGTLADTTTPEEEKVNRLEQAAESTSEAFGTLFKDIISGTTSAEESLSRLFQSIADIFADMVAQMIQEWLKAQIMGLFTKGASAAGGGGMNIGTSGDLF